MVSLGLADEQSQAARSGNQVCGHGQCGVEVFHGAEGDDVGVSGGKILGATGEHIDVRQCKGADDLAQEDYLFLVGFNQCQADVRNPDLYRKAGEAGARAEVSDAERRAGLKFDRVGGEQMARGEKGLAEVAGDNFFQFPHGGEIHAGVPAD
jgi:hypothetical protein